MSARSSGTASISSRTQDTDKRQARPNPESEWIVQDVPELRIVDDELWQAIKTRQAENRIARDDRGQADVATINCRRRLRFLFSGLTKCGAGAIN